MATDKPADETPVAPVENKETKAAALGEDDEFEDFPVDGAFFECAASNTCRGQSTRCARKWKPLQS